MQNMTIVAYKSFDFLFVVFQVYQWWPVTTRWDISKWFPCRGGRSKGPGAILDKTAGGIFHQSRGPEVYFCSGGSRGESEITWRAKAVLVLQHGTMWRCSHICEWQQGKVLVGLSSPFWWVYRVCSVNGKPWKSLQNEICNPVLKNPESPWGMKA